MMAQMKEERKAKTEKFESMQKNLLDFVCQVFLPCAYSLLEAETF